MGGLKFEEGAVVPRYDDYCLSNVHGTVLSLLGVKSRGLPSDVFSGLSLDSVENVVLFLFDGLGMNEWRRLNDGFFGELSQKGKVTEITSTFPSTTSTALTTLVTGLTPQEHGLIEWHMYLKALDEIILTLPFSPLGTKGYDLLIPRADPRILFRGTPIFTTLRREGVGTYSFLNRQIAKSGYTNVVHRSSKVIPYSSSSDLSVAVRRTLERNHGPSFLYVYWSYVDSIEHSFGPNTDESAVEASNISHALKIGLLDRLGRREASRTLFLATADHGQIYSPSEESILLNRYRRLVRSLEVSERGRQILPWGSPRDVYLLIQDERLDEISAYMEDRLDGFANVMKTEDAVAAGLFGRGRPSRKFLERVGNLMILPTGTRSVWFRHPGVEPPRLKGQHGGLHPDEMNVPFAAARASDLL